MAREEPTSRVFRPTSPHSLRVVVSLDDSPQAQAALDWALSHVMAPSTGDAGIQHTLHLVTVVNPVATPVMDDISPAVAAMENKAYRESMQAAVQVISMLKSTIYEQQGLEWVCACVYQCSIPNFVTHK